MSKAVKQLMVEDLTKRLKGVSGLLVCSTKGMTATESVRFRSALRQKNVRTLTVKNAMCSRAFDVLGLDYAKSLLDGPTTLIFGGDGLPEAAKLLVAQLKTFKTLEVRGGAGDGRLLSSKDVQSLSKLPSREELLGTIVGGLLSPIQGVIGAVVAPARQVASQIEKLSERSEAKAA